MQGTNGSDQPNGRSACNKLWEGPANAAQAAAQDFQRRRKGAVGNADSRHLKRETLNQSLPAASTKLSELR